MVKRVLHADLGEGLQLRGIEQKDKLVELEFLFPLRPVTREALAAVYRDAAGCCRPTCRSAWATCVSSRAGAS
jgi:exodeoxyribonuclease V beta subunit